MTANYVVDNTHSTVSFTARHLVFTKVRGRFADWKADLYLDEDLTKSRVAVEIDVASIATGVDKRDEHLRSADFFEVEKFPKLTFVSKRIEPGKGDHFKIIGDLTIRDVTREVVLDAEKTGSGKDPWGGERVAFTAATHVDRSDYGLRWNVVLEAGGVTVSDRIEIEIEIQAIKQ